MKDKIERLKREICHKGGLAKYEKSIGEILLSINEADCFISCCDTCENSRIDQAIDGSFKSHIRIGFKKAKEIPIHYIWDILHEFGHHLSGLPNGNERSIERESQAWDFGFEQLKKYPDLFEQIEDFEKYRIACLETYKKNKTSA